MAGIGGGTVRPASLDSPETRPFGASDLEAPSERRNSVVPTAVSNRLRDARRQGKKRRTRVQYPSALIGVTSIVVGAGFFFAESNTAVGRIGAIVALVGATLLLLSPLPTDTLPVKGTAAFTSLSMTVVGVMYVARVLALVGLWLFGETDEVECTFESLAPAGMPCWYAIVQFVRYSLVAIIWGRGGIGVLMLLVRARPVRATLDGTWRLTGQTCFASSALELGLIAADVIAGMRVDTLPYVLFIVHILLMLLVGLVFMNTQLRARIQAWLASQGAEARSAAKIASLVGTAITSEELMDKSEAMFKCVYADEIKVEMLSREEPQAHTLQTLRAHFGDVDAFVSHSWHDDPDAKYAALQRWAHGFYATHNRRPLVWFDRFCIDQNDIENNLQCMPIWLAGCNTLLVLCGETYLQRLWCVLELYVFIEMGGSKERIELWPLPSAEDSVMSFGESRVKAARMRMTREFARFDVHMCTCHLERDRQKLLGIIEEGFGDLDAFNKEAHKMLAFAAEATRSADIRATAMATNALRVGSSYTSASAGGSNRSSRALVTENSTSGIRTPNASSAPASQSTSGKAWNADAQAEGGAPAPVPPAQDTAVGGDAAVHPFDGDANGARGEPAPPSPAPR